MYSRMKFALFFRSFDSWYIIKFLLTETSGKQYVCGPSTVDVSAVSGPQNIDREHRQSRVHKTYCFPRSQSISVNYVTIELVSVMNRDNIQVIYLE